MWYRVKWGATCSVTKKRGKVRLKEVVGMFYSSQRMEAMLLYCWEFYITTNLSRTGTDIIFFYFGYFLISTFVFFCIELRMRRCSFLEKSFFLGKNFSVRECSGFLSFIDLIKILFVLFAMFNSTTIRACWDKMRKFENLKQRNRIRYLVEGNLA